MFRTEEGYGFVQFAMVTQVTGRWFPYDEQFTAGRSCTVIVGTSMDKAMWHQATLLARCREPREQMQTRSVRQQQHLLPWVGATIFRELMGTLYLWNFM